MTPTPIAARTEQANASSGQMFTPDEARRIIAESRRVVQDVPSYVDQQIAACRGLLESIASQREERSPGSEWVGKLILREDSPS